MLALYIIFGTYFVVCIICGALVGALMDSFEISEDQNEGIGHLDGDN